MKFRPDIDGLRGVAVLLVVAYHAKLRILSGGYVGVDVFLVISGFVITGNLIHLIDHDRFSPVAFFDRRVRRLMPAAVVMVAATLISSWFILGPRDLRTLAGSSIAVLALAANFFFWRHQGYFADQVPEQPLLHTWSLGLEEQFYLLYPPVLLAGASLSRRSRVASFTIATVLLFIFSVWLTRAHAGASFYLLPARAYEFLLGGLIALRANATPPPARLRTAMGVGGVAAILLAALGLTAGTPYPGMAAALPVAGSALVIWANCEPGTLSERLLSTKWLVGIGAASYSLYLWHWPALTLARYHAGRDLHASETVAVLGAVALLTYISWRWVERPFRLGSNSPAPRHPLSTVIALGVLTLTVSAITIAGDGFPSRLSPTALAFDSASLGDAADVNRCHKGPPAVGTLCNFGSPVSTRTHVLVWGDSHANAIIPAMIELAKTHPVTIIQASYSGCPPLLEARLAHTPSQYCLQFNAQVLREVTELGINRALLVAYWAAYLPMRPEPVLARYLDPYLRSGYLAGGGAAQNEHNFAVALRRTVQALESRGVEVWIMRQVPEQGVPVPWALSRAATLGHDYTRLGISLDEYRRSQAQADAQLDLLGSTVHVIDPATRLCASGICVCAYDGQAVYIDSNHLSPTGAQLIEPVLEAVLQ